MQIAGYIDHTILKPTTTIADVQQLCEEAAQYQFAAVCVPPPFVKRAKALCAPFGVKVATVIGFPFGYSAAEAKLAESVLAIVDGADELDVVTNLIAVKEQNWDYLTKEIRPIIDVANQKKVQVKIILESGILTDEEIKKLAQLYSEAGIHFLKTSTGYAEKGASIHQVNLLKENKAPQVKIKASGGIRDYAFAKALVDAGADRLGCSASVAITKGENAGDGNY